MCWPADLPRRSRSSLEQVFLSGLRADFSSRHLSSLPAPAGLGGCWGLPGRTVQQLLVVRESAACGLPDLHRQRPRSDGRGMARQPDLDAAGSVGNLAGRFRICRTGRRDCAHRQCDRGKCDTGVVWHTIAVFLHSLASVVDRRRHRRLDRSAAGTGCVSKLARQDPAFGRAVGRSLRPGADLSRRCRSFSERLPPLRIHHHAASSLGCGSLRVQRRCSILGSPRPDHGAIYDNGHQPVCWRSRVPEAQAGHAAAFSGDLGIFGAHRGRHIPAAPAGSAHIAPKPGYAARPRAGTRSSWIWFRATFGV